MYMLAEVMLLAESTGRAKTVLSIIKALMGILLSVIFYMLVIIAISKMCSVTYDFMYQIFGEVSVQEAPGTDIEFTINEGESTMSVASRMEYGKLIVNKYSFYIRVKLDTIGSGIMPGTYELNTSMSYGEILNKITDYSEGANGEKAK